jgi:hypothetical protein
VGGVQPLEVMSHNSLQLTRLTDHIKNRLDFLQQRRLLIGKEHWVVRVKTEPVFMDFDRV